MGRGTRRIMPLHFPLPRQTWSIASTFGQPSVNLRSNFGQTLCKLTCAGLAVGGEFGSCIVYLYEIAPKRKRGLFSSLGQASIVSLNAMCHVSAGRSTVNCDGWLVCVVLKTQILQHILQRMSVAQYSWDFV
jgi:hypothetical protein